MSSPYLPHRAEIVERIEEASDVFTLRLRLTDNDTRRSYRFAPGQFNMLYLYGVGEVPISIVSDPRDDSLLDHTVRALGHVTRGLSALQVGDTVGVRGPYGRGWPLQAAEGRDVLVVTGGLGCAPVVAAIRYILRRRDRYGRLTILQGVKHSKDLLWREQYEAWARHPDTEVLLAADEGGPAWPWHVGLITELFDKIDIRPGRTLSMMCGPEPMMVAAIRELRALGLGDGDIYASMERNMQCAVGHCGHCQIGGSFVCRNGPVFPYTELAELLGRRGF
ncbi:MAG TPA: FAD/NAD(P)-binding protein [Gammaproteobacteria bacterium]|nr:FAD/NAD(P)-binding protein [Gammaproteobacteria bacterium]